MFAWLAVHHSSPACKLVVSALVYHMQEVTGSNPLQLSLSAARSTKLSLGFTANYSLNKTSPSIMVLSSIPGLL